MIRHIVLLKSSEAIEPVIEELRAFCAGFEGVIAFSSGLNMSIEPPVMHGYSHGFVIDFENSDARDRYVLDEGHQAIGAKIVALADGGIDGVLVFDMVMSG